MRHSAIHYLPWLFIILLLPFITAGAQDNFVLNGGFEDVNICTEYNSACGVEAWFYMKEVKAQMLGNDSLIKILGNNSFGIQYHWMGYTGFSPVIGTLLPCGLQANHRYLFKGMITANLNPRLTLKPGICLGEKFYVPQRSFSKNMKPDTIVYITPVPHSGFFEFEYSFLADGKEKYLTFGTYIREDTTGAKKKLIGTQTVSIVLDNFQLIPENKNESPCPDFLSNKEKIYNYNFRHKEMDYSLFGNGELAIDINNNNPGYFTRLKEPVIQSLHPDTLQLGDVFFDFNKAKLKQEAVLLLDSFFNKNGHPTPVDSLYIDGHTDSIGTDKSNIELSNQRCETIREWLLQHTIISTQQIFIHPYGESQPIATNGTKEGRALNRRVEMIIFRKTEK